MRLIGTKFQERGLGGDGYGLPRGFHSNAEADTRIDSYLRHCGVFNEAFWDTLLDPLGLKTFI
jgi:hypothetical protein